MSSHRHETAEKRPCQYCQQLFSPKGLSRHKKACQRTQEEARYIRELQQGSLIPQDTLAGDHEREPSLDVAPDQPVFSAFLTQTDSPSSSGMHHDESPYTASHDSNEHSHAEDPDSSNRGSAPQLDDIKVEYHPHSKRPPEIWKFEEFKRHRSQSAVPPPNQTPWKPFRTRIDFEFAEITLSAALNSREINVLIDIIHRARDGDDSFTIKNSNEFSSLWDGASEHLTPFNCDTISVPYKTESKEFDVHTRPLMSLAEDIAGDPYLSAHIHWDAERLFKWNGHDWIRFIDEPWTADRMWNIQSRLPPEAKPFCWVLFADKTKLSSFGTAMGYPVIARFAQLPVELRNGEGVGGGYIVGWLPVIAEDSAETGKTGYVNFKRVVWHEAFLRILESVIEASKNGTAYPCGDSITRWLFHLILILSADYEEQCVMALIRGIGGKCPCPICLVPSEKLSDLSLIYPARTSEHTQRILREASLLSKPGKEEILKSFGLRDIENVFFAVANSDPYQALSFDRLHAHAAGLFGDHIWTSLKLHIEDLGRGFSKQVDNQMACLPHWRNINHFNEVMKVSFTDGTKFEDISKLILFATHNILTPNHSPGGYKLLCCLRSYLNLTMYAGLEVHTSETLAAGRRELQRFSTLLHVYAQGGTKNWNFPKVHTHQHCFDDIEAKGASRNFNTKPNEKRNGVLKDSYYLRTNGKDVAKQLLRADHWCLVSAFLRSRVDALDEYLHAQEHPHVIDDEGIQESLSPSSHHISLGAKQPARCLQDIEKEHVANLAFKNFRHRLSGFFNVFLSAHGRTLPGGKAVKLQKDDEITEYRFLKVNYESTVHWRQVSDYLRCNPSFHKCPRYDGVLVHTVEGPIFARLVFLFTCITAGSTYPLALIQPYDVPVAHLQVDMDLGFKSAC